MGARFDSVSRLTPPHRHENCMPTITLGLRFILSRFSTSPSRGSTRRPAARNHANSTRRPPGPLEIQVRERHLSLRPRPSEIPSHIMMTQPSPSKIHPHIMMTQSRFSGILPRRLMMKTAPSVLKIQLSHLEAPQRTSMNQSSHLEVAP